MTARLTKKTQIKNIGDVKVVNAFKQGSSGVWRWLLCVRLPLPTWIHFPLIFGVFSFFLGGGTFPIGLVSSKFGLPRAAETWRALSGYDSETPDRLGKDEASGTCKQYRCTV